MLQQWRRAALPGRSWRATRVLALLPVSRAFTRRHSSSSGGPAQGLGWDELNLASQVAKWSGYCYVPAAQLAQLVQADGLQLVAHGRTHYTSWYIADGCMDHQPLYQLANKLVTTGASAADVSSSNSKDHSQVTSSSAVVPHTSNFNSHELRPVTAPVTAPGTASGTVAEGLAPKARRTRFVFLRGVQWAAPDASVSAITQALVNFWPTAFPPVAASQGTTAQQPDQQLQPSQWQQGGKQGNMPLVAHAGVTMLAADLYRQIEPWLDSCHDAPAGTEQQPLPAAQGNTPLGTSSSSHMSAPGRANFRQPAGTSLQTGNVQHSAALSETMPGGGSAATRERLPVCIAGHSLGGSLGLLLMTQGLLNSRLDPAHVQCFMFGSPPVLAHKDGGGGHRVLQLLGLPDHAVCSFVLEHDPIPRALMSADPTFHALKRYEPIRQLLETRGWISSATQQALQTVVTGLTGLLRLGTASKSPASRASGASGGAAPNSQQPDAPPLASPVLSPSRFIFENVGSVYFMRGGAELVPISNTTQLDQLLAIALEDFINQPARALQAVLDHHHVSYAHDLETAALALLKRELRARQRQQQVAAYPQRQLHTQARQHVHGTHQAVQTKMYSQSRLQQSMSAGQQQQQAV